MESFGEYLGILLSWDLGVMLDSWECNVVILKLVVKKCLMKLFSDVGRLGFRWIDVCKEFL